MPKKCLLNGHFYTGSKTHLIRYIRLSSKELIFAIYVESLLSLNEYMNTFMKINTIRQPGDASFRYSVHTNPGEWRRMAAVSQHDALCNCATQIRWGWIQSLPDRKITDKYIKCKKMHYKEYYNSKEFQVWNIVQSFVRAGMKFVLNNVIMDLELYLSLKF